ncbi:glycoside hydrolase family 26 protein [Clostridium felsineum]|uniref:Endoglucanase H n=1 Tax=Clostridium felsineum TaxID=36839 RepID=A0A1S8LF40_9CLOT|nr:glycosyl hydrolase [Clostridium felsineum]URZ07408.1 Endoglucanase H [Clostridium felsineum]URZ12439.1 Endoglucanase H [Clostridium felsineum]
MFFKNKFKLVMLSISILIFSLGCFGNGLKVSANRVIKYGAFFADQPTTQGIKDFESLQRKHLDEVNMFINWNTNFSDVKSNFDAVYGDNSTMSLTWEAWGLSNMDIVNGKKDAYIKQMALDMKAYKKNIIIRLFHEGNGNWYDWAVGDSKVNTNETYKAAFRHVVDIFRSVEANNVKWNFNVNCSSVGNGSSYLGQYPGDDYVDTISIDGYNWGTTQSWGSKWQSFDEIFSQPYNALKVKNKPIEISEFSSTEIGGNKAAWYTDAFNQLNSDKYSLINSVVCFSINKETDWRINSSASALRAYIAGIHR